VWRKRNLTGLIDDKACGQRIQAAIELRNRIVAKQNPIIDFVLGDVRLNGRPAILIHRNAEHREALRFITLLKLSEPGNFNTTRPAPRRPEIEQNNFATIIGQFRGCAIGIFQREIRSGGSMFGGFDGARADLLRGTGRKAEYGKNGH